MYACKAYVYMRGCAIWSQFGVIKVIQLSTVSAIILYSIQLYTKIEAVAIVC